ncbi:hypothetical protein IAU60_001114 [Kwoniella sp. DSM 27419]
MTGSSSPSHPQHPDRPFSPSPPRENRHSASRPVSMLFGAPPVAPIPLATPVNASGLSATPTPDHRRLGRSISHENVKDAAKSLQDIKPRRRYESEQIIKDDVFSDDEIRGRHPHRRQSSEDRDASLSTTSSASPPLGATSLLSAIAAPTQGTPAHLRLDSQASMPMTPSFDFPASPVSVRSESSFSSATIGLSSAKSQPRIHQPTVIRKPSGRGLIFLPTPPHVASSASSLIHHPSSLNGNSIQVHHPADPDASRGHTKSESWSSDHSFAASDADGSQQARTREVSHLMGETLSEDQPGTETTTDEVPLGPLLEVEEELVVPNINRETRDPAAGLQSSINEVSPKSQDSMFNGIDEASQSSSMPSDELMPHEAEQPILNEVYLEQVGNREMIPSEIPKHKNHPDDDQDSSSPVSEASALGTTGPAPQQGKNPEGLIHASNVPYKPRPGSRTFASENNGSDPDSRAISVYAVLGAAQQPVPYAHPYRLELHLVWGTGQIMKWLPGRRYIPDWNLKLVGGDANEPHVLDVRVIAKSLVGQIPVIRRLAPWL